MYDYTSPADLCRWAEQRLSRKTIYQLGGIGRYDSSGRRVFDCVGLIKCYLWHDYGPGNTGYYGKTAPDINADQMYSRATVKGPISTIPEIPGLLVWQPGHIGIYIGGGQVIESTAKRWGSVGNCVVKSQFRDKTAAMYRGTWTHWLRCPFLMYPEEGSKMYLKPGYQSIAWQGQTIHVYKRRDDQEIGLMSAGGDKVLKTIDKIDDDHIHHCKVNCSYFVMSGSDRGTVCGRHQGFTADGRPDQIEWLDVVVTKDNKLIAGDLASWEYPGNDGIDVLAVVSGKLNGAACRQFAQAYGMVYCAMLDSGGSSQMIVDGAKKRYTGRALPNVLTLYKIEAKPEPDPQPDTKPNHQPDTGGDGMVLITDKGPLCIRNAVVGNKILYVVPQGEQIDILDMLPGRQKDGYQWAFVSYVPPGKDKIIGYSQVDGDYSQIDEKS